VHSIILIITIAVITTIIICFSQPPYTTM